jgi:adenosine deaminase CECR1
MEMINHSPDERASQSYRRARRELLESEASNAWDRKVSLAATSVELAAAKIVLAIREYERRTIFGNVASEEMPGPETLEMGGQFLTNKKRIEEQSLLFKIAQRLPKGAILHLHFNAGLDPGKLLKEARQMESMYVWSSKPLLTKADLASAEIVFKIFPTGSPSFDIFRTGYNGGGGNGQRCMKWSEFRTGFTKRFSSLFPKSPGDDLDSAECWIKEKIVFNEHEIYDPTQTVNG